MSENEPDDRTVAERQLEQAMEKIEKHHPHIARRLRAIWKREKDDQRAESMRAVAASNAQMQRDRPYADEPDIANEEAAQPIGLWGRFWGGRGG